MYFADAAALRRVAIPDEHKGYVLPFGIYALTQSTVNIGPDNMRLVPDTNSQADCAIAALGDSVTFGSGVDDDATWVNQLAALYPGIHFINTAFRGYNSANIRGAYESVPADGYIYLIIGNDNQLPAIWSEGWRDDRPSSGMSRYLYVLLNREEPSLWSGFEKDMQAILGSDVLAFAFEGDALTPWLREHHPEVILLPLWTSRISSADVHPDREGHAEIVEGMVGYVDGWIREICEETI